jgi:cyclopropane-fatty-acyl-phospholipid synthase
MGLSKRVVSSLFEKAGVKIGESNDADLVVHDPSFFNDVLLRGSLGFGDSYIEGKWDSDKIDEVVFKILSQKTYRRIAHMYNGFRSISRRFINFQTRKGAKKVIEEHYDLPAEFYASFLDPYMQYTCGLFEGTNDLNEAQENKMRLVCKKLRLKKGNRVLDLGGGWGGLARFMRQRYEVQSTVVTLSQAQANHIRRTGDGIEVLVCDYRDVPKFNLEKFDAVSAVGILEHVGHKNYDSFMRVVNQSLKAEGMSLLQTLYTPYSRPTSDPWLTKHIFPNGELSPRKFIEASARPYFRQSEGTYAHFHELTPNYYPTLLAWDKNFKRAISEGKIDISERERRKWCFYFMSCAGAIKAEHMRVGQFLYQKI